ncbi:Ltp family lipoprotein [Mumia sp.]|uniref:Ltp family lipoprotein n=1 Tax=Mumia sp. TaxID=1965300 RepID=UPI00260DA473|nr:Ltp family lipoprotein [Mumia sp.]MDD9348393.1 Ltp family lipoprotein [Mumia sp.]
MDDAKAQRAAAKAYAKAQRPWYRKKRFIIPLALVVVGVIAVSSGEESEAGSTTTGSSTTSEGNAAPKPSYTKSQEEAIEAAESYLDTGHFSKKGLIGQLSSSAGEGFTRAEAEHAVTTVDADWKAEAVEAAESYVELGGFSRSGLIDQLTSSAGEGFTQAEAEYAVTKVGL